MIRFEFLQTALIWKKEKIAPVYYLLRRAIGVTPKICSLFIKSVFHCCCYPTLLGDGGMGPGPEVIERQRVAKERAALRVHSWTV